MLGVPQADSSLLSAPRGNLSLRPTTLGLALGEAGGGDPPSEQSSKGHRGHSVCREEKDLSTEVADVTDHWEQLGQLGSDPGEDGELSTSRSWAKAHGGPTGQV